MTPELIETLNKFNWSNNTDQRHIIDLLQQVIEEHGPNGLKGVLEIGLGS